MLPCTLTLIDRFEDEFNNKVVCEEAIDKNNKIIFRGSRNTVTVKKGARLEWVTIEFDCDDGVFEIGSHRGVASFKGYIRIGEQCRVLIGDNVSATNRCLITVAERTSVSIGDDVMLAADVELRADDAHPIFDVPTGARINMPKEICVGNHVWIGRRAAILGGTAVGDGSVVGYGSIVKGKFPNNCVVAGVPAKLIRRNIAWERPHLSGVAPFYKPDASYVSKSDYWNLTEDDDFVG